MKVIITDTLDAAASDLLDLSGIEVEQIPANDIEAIKEAVKDARGWIVRSGTQVTAELIACAEQLVVIGRAGVGVDNIDVDAATRAGIAVVNTPSGNTIAAVEHTLAMTLALARNVPQAHGSLVRDGLWERSKFTGVELYGKSMGIIGLGKIGSRVATRCRAFEMTILAYDPYLTEERAASLGVELCTNIEDLLSRSDFVSLHMPGSVGTEKLLNRERLAVMKPGARIINCARGNLIDEQALADALVSGHVAGAALDVFASEPPADSPLMDTPNLIGTPHLGASTRESQRNVGVQVAEQVCDAVLKGVFKDAVNIPVQDWATMEKLMPQLNLLERLGLLAQQYARAGITRVDIEYAGGPFEEIPALNNTFLKGLLTPSLGGQINAVNASLLAKERGMTLAHTERDDSGGYRSLINVVVTTESATHKLSATMFEDGLPRLVMLDGYEVDVYLEGNLVLFGNFDRPGVIGSVGELLGRNGINIAHFSLGRRRTGGEALAIVAVDQGVSAGVVAELVKLENMKWVIPVSLGSSPIRQ